jgi:hypothetical protein
MAESQESRRLRPGKLTLEQRLVAGMGDSDPPLQS